MVLSLLEKVALLWGIMFFQYRMMVMLLIIKLENTERMLFSQ